MKFSHKLALTLVGVAVLPIVVAGVVLVRLQREMLTAHIRESHLALAQSLADEFRQTTQHIRRDLTATGAVINTPPLKENDVLVLLDAYLRENTMVRAVGMYDVRGSLIETMTKNPSEPSDLPLSLPSSILAKLQSLDATAQTTTSVVWWPESRPTAQKERLGSDTSYSIAPFLPIIVTVRGDRFSGRLVAMLSRQDCASFLNASALRAFGVERGVIHCVDSDYRLVASTQGVAQDINAVTEDILRKQFFVQSRSGNADEINGNNDAAKNTAIALQNTTYFQSIGVSQEYVNARGENVVATKATVPFTNLNIIIEQPVSWVYKSLFDMQKWLFFVCFAVCGIALGLGYYFAGQVLRPLRQMVEAGEAMRQQNFHVRLHRTENDEFAFLFGTFNEAAIQLEHYQRLDVNTVLLERNKLEVIMRQAGYGVLVLTPERTVMLANDTLAGYLRQDPLALEGVSVDVVLRDYEQLCGYIDKAFTETNDPHDTIYIKDLVFLTSDEITPRIFQVMLNKIILDRQLVALVVSFLDCSPTST